MINEAWLSHGASRLESRGSLMFVTMVHLLGASVWAGGVFHLLLSWRVINKNSEDSELVANSCDSVFTGRHIVGGAHPDSRNILRMELRGALERVNWYGLWQYVGGEGRPVYPHFGLSRLQFSCWTIMEIDGKPGVPCFLPSLPYIEVEIVLAGTVLFTAAALTSFPPAIDVSQDTVSPAEMWMMFSPKLPHLSGPELVMIDAPELTDLRTGKVGQKEDWSWDRFNHNISGMVVVVLALLAFIDCMRWGLWARHWPMLFVGFSILIVVFANPDHWPLGPISFIDSATDTEVVQHWLAGCIVFGLGGSSGLQGRED